MKSIQSNVKPVLSWDLILFNMNLSFAGCGFLGIYHIGVACCFKQYAPHLLLDKIAGASAGAIAACCLLCDLPIGKSKFKIKLLYGVVILPRSRCNHCCKCQGTQKKVVHTFGSISQFRNYSQHFFTLWVFLTFQYYNNVRNYFQHAK